MNFSTCTICLHTYKIHTCLPTYMHTYLHVWYFRIPRGSNPFCVCPILWLQDITRTRTTFEPSGRFVCDCVQDPSSVQLRASLPESQQSSKLNSTLPLNQNLRKRDKCRTNPISRFKLLRAYWCWDGASENKLSTSTSSEADHGILIRRSPSGATPQALMDTTTLLLAYSPQGPTI